MSGEVLPVSNPAFEHMFDGVIVVDKEQRIISANTSAERIFGYGSGELIGRDVQLLVAEGCHFHVDNYVRSFQHANGRKIGGVKCRLQGRRKDGAGLRLDAEISEINIGEQIFLAAILRAASEPADLPKTGSGAELNPSNRALANFSHEVRTPLSSIIGYTQLMLGEHVNRGEMRRMAQVVLNNGRRLLKIIKDLDDVSTAEAEANKSTLAAAQNKNSDWPDAAKPAPRLGGTVLLADDDNERRELMEALIRSTGAKCVLAEDGKTAVAEAVRQEFDLILLDMQIHEVGGFQVARELRENGINHPIVALTGTQETQFAFQAGCNEHLGKLFEIEQFYNLLARYLPAGEARLAEQIERSDEGLDLTTLFLNGLNDRLRSIEESFERLDWRVLAVEAGRLRTAAVAGFEPLGDAAGELEQAAKGRQQETALLAISLIKTLAQTAGTHSDPAPRG